MFISVQDFNDNTDRQVRVYHTEFLMQCVVVLMVPCRSVTGIIAINEERGWVSFFCGHILYH